jgi:hypothetical protein
LFYLIVLRTRAARLQIQDFLDAVAKEKVVAAAHAHLKAEPLELQAQTVERNIRIGIAEKNFFQQFGGFAHVCFGSRGRSPHQL